MLLVIGATGTVGSQVLAHIRDGGHEVRALVRTEQQAQHLRGVGAEAVLGDLDEPGTLGAAFDSVSRVFLATPAGPAQVERETAVIRAAATAGAGVVKLSVIGADPGSAVRFAAAHGVIEGVLADAGLPHTLLRPNDFMQNAFRWAEQLRSGTMATPNADDRIASIDVRDIAAVAVAALTGDGHEGRTYELSGPEALTRRQQIAAIAAELGREVQVVALTPDQARDAMTDAGVPAGAADALHDLLALVYQAGHGAAVTSDVTTVTGRPATTWAAFVHEHADVWR